MDISTIYIALVFLVPFVLGLTLLSAMVFDLGWAARVTAKPETASTATRKVAINRANNDVGCYA